MRNLNTLLSVVVVFAIFALMGCSSDNQVTEPETPDELDLPSVSTMTMDVDFFKSAQMDSQAVMLGKFEESSIAASPTALKLNYFNAAVRVFFLNVVAYSALAEPVAAFTTAIHSVPQYQEDGSWLWTYVYIDNHGSEYSIFLNGKRMDTYVAWNMEVSCNDPNLLLDHFLWFDGQVAIGGHSGYWQFYEPDTSSESGESEAETPGVQCIRIDWDNNGLHDRQSTFLINKLEDTAYGSTLTFDEAPDVASIEFFDAANETTGTIIWYADGTGSIEWPDYKDGVRSCWDVWQFDVDCE
ncbi:MAG: hypothetical protein R3F48_02705 [Candidatus Zixiibacteriota bacterium]